jgi:16S rRNA (adenine1518-N6/adenine1519-N6)-dimethyltransferase
MQHRARKRFGQNFLIDRDVIARLVETVCPQPEDLLIEIGPGQAAMTLPLADSGAEMVLLEIDRDLAARLRTDFAAYPKVSIHEGDALKEDLGALAGSRPFRLLGNLPYNISTPLLFHALQWSDQIRDMHFMLQQEVVQRLAAVPGSKAWGRLSIMCQYRCAVAPLFDVPPTAFSPAPRVTSSVVRLVPHASPPVQVDDPAGFERVVKQAFSQRRKTLRNSLRSLVDAAAMEAAGIDPGARPETLGLGEFAVLSRLLADQ